MKENQLFADETTDYCKCDAFYGRQSGIPQTNGEDYCYIKKTPCKLPAVPNPDKTLEEDTFDSDEAYPYVKCTQNGTPQIECDGNENVLIQ